MTDALSPRLTPEDQRILDLLPVLTFDQSLHSRAGLTAHAVAEALDTDDIADIRRVLNGMVQLGHAERSTNTVRAVRYWREAP